MFDINFRIGLCRKLRDIQAKVKTLRVAPAKTWLAVTAGV